MDFLLPVFTKEEMWSGHVFRLPSAKYHFLGVERTSVLEADISAEAFLGEGGEHNRVCNFKQTCRPSCPSIIGLISFCAFLYSDRHIHGWGFFFL